jgi:hypothetical protein
MLSSAHVQTRTTTSAADFEIGQHCGLSLSPIKFIAFFQRRQCSLLLRTYEHEPVRFLIALILVFFDELTMGYYNSTMFSAHKVKIVDGEFTQNNYFGSSSE